MSRWEVRLLVRRLFLRDLLLVGEVAVVVVVVGEVPSAVAAAAAAAAEAAAAAAAALRCRRGRRVVVDIVVGRGCYVAVVSDV